MLAQIDYMDAELKGIKFSPTFAVFHRGRKVDNWHGSNARQLADHVWLHSED